MLEKMVSMESPMGGIIQQKVSEFALEPLVAQYVTIVALGVLEEGGSW